MYICTKCGGQNVESLNWMDLNTGEVDSTDEVNEYFCRDCNSPTDIEFVSSSFDEDIGEEVTKMKENEENNS